jgi:sugar/nucleoside kinase (ribokinase family)
MTRGGRLRRSVLSYGFIALDVIRSGNSTWLAAGGTAANVTANLSYLGWRASLIGQIGADEAGNMAARDLRSAGVDVSRLRRSHSLATPLIVHEVRESGHRYQFGCRHCKRSYSSFRPMSRERFLNAWGGMLADVFFLDRVSLGAIVAAEQHASSNRLVVYEPSTRGSVQLHKRAVEAATIVKYSRDRAVGVFDDGRAAPSHQLRIVTEGRAGTRFRIGGGAWVKIEALPAHVVDAGGAGDWMTAAFLQRLSAHDRWEMAEVREGLAFAQAVAALSCALPGARTLARAIRPVGLSDAVDELISGGLRLLALPRRSLPSAKHERRCRGCLLPIAPPSRSAE